jgi:hypothetical protein
MYIVFSLFGDQRPFPAFTRYIGTYVGISTKANFTYVIGRVTTLGEISPIG